MLRRMGRSCWKRLGADRVFYKEGSKIFDRVAAANGVRKIEALMEIDYPVAIFADAFSHLGALLAHVVNALPGVVGSVCRRLRGAEAEGAIAGFDGEPGAIFEGRIAGYSGDDAGGVVALDMVAHHAAQHLMDGQALDFALDVPKGQVEGADRVRPLAACGVEKGAIHVLPETLDVLRVAADESPCGLGQGVLHATLADACDSGVGLDGDYYVALVEERVGMRRQVGSHAGDLHLGDRSSVGRHSAQPLAIAVAARERRKALLFMA